MRKTLYICGALLGLMLTSCGNKTSNASSDVDSVEQEVLADSVIAQLDSLADIIGELSSTNDIKTIFSTNSINLTEQQKKVKPDYLLTQNDIKDLVTLQEKYVAEAYLVVDQNIAKLYDLDDDDYYANNMARLASETENTNQAISDSAKNAPLSMENAKAFYNEMKTRHRLDKFYIAEAAYIVEALWIISNNTAVYMPVLNDAQAASICKHLSTVVSGVDILASSNEDMKAIADALAPLKGINATTTAQLKEQIEKAYETIATARKALLKA